MKLRFLLTALFVAIFTATGNAQQPDNAAILQAIQGLAGKVDGLQKDVDRLKAAPSANRTTQMPSGKPAPAAPASTASTKQPGRSVPGWLVNVVPGDDDAKDAVATFNGPLSDFNFGLHSKYTDAKTEFSYQGAAFFHPDQAGRYVFMIKLYPNSTCCEYGSWSFECTTLLKIADNVVVTGETRFGYDFQTKWPENHEFSRNMSFSGGADLEAVDYKIAFVTNCYADEKHKGDTLGKIFGPWQHNRFSILVKGPDDGAARPFEANELFHVGKAKKS